MCWYYRTIPIAALTVCTYYYYFFFFGGGGGGGEGDGGWGVLFSFFSHKHIALLFFVKETLSKPYDSLFSIKSIYLAKF